MARLQFIGAAQEVTGSCHLLESDVGGRILLDCGMHQGGDAIDRLSQEHFPFSPANIDAVLLSHAHLDHCGLLPKLIHAGFTGPIYCTKATAELLKIMLEDAANIYEKDLEKENLRHARKGSKKLKSAYNRSDVGKVLKRCKPQAYGSYFEVSPALSACFHDAGHILGSAVVEVRVEEKQQVKTLVFSGDLGKKGAVLMNDPQRLSKADIVLMEGTYGNRDHRSEENTLEQFSQVLGDTWKRGGNVLIPAFAVGRTQELIFHLGRLHHRGELDDWQVVLDSPMAIEVTRVYDRWLHTLDCQDVKNLCNGDRTLLEDFLPRLQLAVTTEQSIAINGIKKGAIIIAGSGMCTGGRIRHHFKQRIWDKRNTILFVGFQARGTLGRILVDGVKKIKLFGEEFVVKSSIETLGGFSAHAGQRELIDWICSFEGDARIFLVHGEAEVLDTLSQKLWIDHGLATEVPARGQSIAF